MLRNRSETGMLACLLSLLAGCAPASLSSALGNAQGAAVPPGQVETGAHWADIADFPTLQRLSYQFVITMVSPSHPEEWAMTFDAAAAASLKLIVGVYPPPYSLQGEEWTISDAGKRFLRYAASRAALVKGIYVYNEPYWVNPFTKANDPCGAVSAERLRRLRSAIRLVWSEAQVFHDIGQPAAWAPGGFLLREHPCIGDKYADPSGVADLVGLWFYPIELARDRRTEALAVLKREIAYVRARMHAEPILAGQAFGCRTCDLTRMPTARELRKWNCATRALGPQAVSWYPWRQEGYDDYLSNHPELWSLTGPAACH